MRRLSILRYLLAISLISGYCFQSISVSANSTFSFSNFENTSKVESLLDLHGHAEVVNGGSSLLVKDGWILYRKLIKLFDVNGETEVSFSTSFSFSKFHRSGDSLSFLLLPIGFLLNESFSVELSKHGHHHSGDCRLRIQNHGVTLKALDVSFPNLKHDIEKLRVWIDYEAGSRQLEIRMAPMIEECKPIEALLSYPIDLLQLWKHRTYLFFVGFSGLMGEGCSSMYSWSFDTKVVPHWMHSMPADPNALSNKEERGKNRDSLAIVLGGVACGALVVLVVMMIVGSKSKVVQDEDCIEFHKLKVIENGKSLI